MAARSTRGRLRPGAISLSDPGDTIWMGAIDATASRRQLHPEHLPGIRLRRRAPVLGRRMAEPRLLFSLDPAARQTRWNPAAGLFTPLNPAFARSRRRPHVSSALWAARGRRNPEAAIFTRFVTFGHESAGAICAPRWVLGRTWGSTVTNLRMESRFDPALIDALRNAGHDVELVGPFEEIWSPPAQSFCTAPEIRLASSRALPIHAATAGPRVLNKKGAAATATPLSCLRV